MVLWAVRFVLCRGAYTASLLAVSICPIKQMTFKALDALVVMRGLVIVTGERLTRVRLRPWLLQTTFSALCLPVVRLAESLTVNWLVTACLVTHETTPLVGYLDGITTGGLCQLHLVR